MFLNQVDKYQNIGQIFTPNYIAKFMVKNIDNILKNTINKYKKELTILEPSVGMGVFLKNLQKYQYENIIAYEIDNSLEEYLRKEYPRVIFRFENVLGSPLDEKFDIIIGNPPYLGQNYNALIFQEYVKKFPICKKYFVGNMDLFYYFIHLGIEKLNPGGILTFITTSYWINKSKKTGIKFLKPHILNECFLLQYFDLSNLVLFNKAKGQHNCIFVLKKKTIEEKSQKAKKKIDVLHIKKINNHKIVDKEIIKSTFNKLIYNKPSNIIRNYKSALTNNELKIDTNWNLLYPKEVREIVDELENYCKYRGKLNLLKDYFIIRNGIIFIKDDIFILQKDKNLKIENKDFYINVNGSFKKLTEIEKKRLKKIFKSKSIKRYGYLNNDYIGYGIFFNKKEIQNKDKLTRNKIIEQKYPNISAYIKEHKKELKETLRNAKEDPKDIFFPRRGAFIHKLKKNYKKLINLENCYDSGKKIFFKYISNKNFFGYSISQYYATSDTYFLWPKLTEKELDYLFFIAYLNSKIVYFLFKAKNIKIKRSKTKLENQLIIPYMNYFRTENDMILLSIIRILSSYMIKITTKNETYKHLIFDEEFYRLNCFSYLKINKILDNVGIALDLEKKDLIQEIIDDLFFKLFKLNKEKIDNLLYKYYD